MTAELRKTGIPVVDDMPWGTHFCHFYETKEDLLEILIPYFKTGLENNEFCMWVVFEPLDEEEARKALRGAIPEAERHLAAGDIEILSHRQWYLKGGTFDLKTVIDGWQEKLAQALSRGYAGMRVNGNEAWLKAKDWKHFAEYEERLNGFITNQRIIVLCTYPLAVTKAAELFDVARTHQFAIAKRHGNWEVVETPELMQAKTEIMRLNEDLERRVAARTEELVAANEELQREIIERKRLEATLRQAHERTESILASVADIHIVFDTQWRYVYVNEAAVRAIGRPREQLLGVSLWELYPDIIGTELESAYRRAMDQRIPVCLDYHYRTTDTWWKNRFFPAREGLAVFATDITERKRVEEALRQSEEKYRLVVDNAQEAILIAQDGMLRFVNPKAVDLLSYGERELLSKPFVEFIHPDDREMVLENYARRMQGEKFSTRYSFRTLRKDGKHRWVDIDSALISWEGRPAALIFMTDITERVRMEEALKESEEQYRTLVEESFDGMFIHRGSRLLFANSRLHEMLGYLPEEMEGVNHWMLYHRDCQKLVRERATARLRDEDVVSQYEVKLQRKDGTCFDAEISGRGVKVKGKPAVLVWVRDVSERKRSEAAQRLLATAVAQTAEAIVITDTLGEVQYVNPAFETITGYTRKEVIGQNTRLLKSGEHDQMFYRNLWETIQRGEVWTGRFINRRKEGRLYHEDSTISPVRDSSGNIANFVAVKRDITEQVQLTAQLPQAQKMEAIGTLAGGIAHDFNNLLQVTLGYSELLLAEKQKDDPEYADLEKILRAAKSGAELVKSLLTFSRKVETKPVPLNLNRRVIQVEKLLRRTIPKMIEIELDLSHDLAEVSADPTQVEQILMNLAVNARDAMPDKGRLTIVTKNVSLDEEYCKLHVEAKPGEYVMLSVSDTGHGMTKETVEHIFEPFYTTKEFGRGTGLGLAMVYGIVKQHGGFISCYSEVGHGTTFNIYFPAIETQMEPDLERTGVMPAFGTETILLVDDEELVRDLGARILRKAGYNVLTAANGREALDLFEKERAQISLVILDLIMPDMGGKQCLEELRKIDPQLKILIASGLSDAASVQESIKMGAKGFIYKPFKSKELLRQVRGVLDEVSTA
jgi:two-component system cell cycle sensor histidine kinase/response regulator CckA